MRPNLRDHLANERTFLAWLRTGLAVIAIGFVIARFSFSLTATPATAAPTTSTLQSSIVGAALILLGTLLIPLAFYQFLKVRREINVPETIKPANWLIVVLAVLVMGLGAALFMIMVI